MNLEDIADPRDLGIDLLANQDIPFVAKGWGHERWIANSPQYCGKLLYIAQGRAFSYHYHKLKTEHFFIESGSIELRVSFQDDPAKARVFYLGAGKRFKVVPGLRHQVTALQDTRMFEFSTEHFDSDSYTVVPGDKIIGPNDTIKGPFYSS